MDKTIKYDVWNNDLTIARNKYSKNTDAELIKMEFEAEGYQFTKRMSVSEAEDLIRELSDYIRWIKEG